MKPILMDGRRGDKVRGLEEREAQGFARSSYFNKRPAYAAPGVKVYFKPADLESPSSVRDTPMTFSAPVTRLLASPEQPERASSHLGVGV